MDVPGAKCQKADAWKIQRELIWDPGDASANQAVFCPLLSQTTTTGSLFTRTHWRWDSQCILMPAHTSGILSVDLHMRNPQSWALCHTRTQVKSKQKTLLCCFNSPLQLKCKPWTIWPWVCRMWWELRESRRFHMTFPQWDEQSCICCRPHQQLQSQTLPMWAANPCPGRLWKIMGCSREEPDLLLHKTSSLNCHCVWNF